MKVQVSGFQVLKDASIDIEGITMVTGSNNHGKSSIMRAIESSFFSDQGEDFINDTMNLAQVRVSLPEDKKFEGLELVWTKSRNGGAVYHVNGQRYAKDRGRPPSEELNKHGIREVKVRDKKQRLFFWRLHDALFMVVDHPSYVFGFISNLMEEEKIIPILKDMSKEGEEVKNRLKRTENQEQVYKEGVTSLEERLDKLKYVEEQKVNVEAISQGGQFYRDLHESLQSVEAYEVSIQKLAETINYYREFLPGEDEVRALERQLSDYQYLIGVDTTLQQIDLKLRNLKESKKILLPKTKLRKSVNGIETDMKILKYLQDSLQSILGIDGNILTIKELVKEGKKEITEKKKELDILKKEIGVCPLCETKFDRKGNV